MSSSNHYDNSNNSYYHDRNSEEESSSKQQQQSTTSSSSRRNRHDDDARAHTRQGITFYCDGHLPEALLEFQQALKQRQEESCFYQTNESLLQQASSYFHIAMVLSDQGKYENAQSEYSKALAIQSQAAPNSLKVAETHDALGYVLYKQGFLEQALHEYQRALHIRQLQAPLTISSTSHRIGLVLRDQHQYHESIKYLRRALELEEQKAPVSIHVASLYFAMGTVYYYTQSNDSDDHDDEAAIRHYRKALSLYGQLGESESLEVAACHYEIGKILYYQRKELETALVEFRNALAVQEFQAPGSIKVAATCSSMGNVLLDQDEVGQALKVYRRACDIYQKKCSVDNPMVLAQSYHDIGRALQAGAHSVSDNDDDDDDDDDQHHHLALDAYRKGLSIRESHAPGSIEVAESHEAIGRVLFRLKDLEGAREEFCHALEIRESQMPGTLDLAQSYHDVGCLLHRSGDLEEALEKCQRALEIRERLAPESLILASSYSDVGSLLYELGDLEGALDLHLTAVTIQQTKQPGSLHLAKSQVSVGLVLMDHQDFVAAIVEFTKAGAILNQSRLDLSDTHPLRIANTYFLGTACLKQNLYKKAQIQAEKILAVLPPYKWAHVLKAKAMMGLGFYQAAVDSFAEAVSMSPNYGDAHLGKAEALLALAQTTCGGGGERQELVEMRLSAVESALKAAFEVDPSVEDYVDTVVMEKLQENLSPVCKSREGPCIEAIRVPKPAVPTKEFLWKELDVVKVELRKLRARLLAEESSVKQEEKVAASTTDEITVPCGESEDNETSQDQSHGAENKDNQSDEQHGGWLSPTEVRRKKSAETYIRVEVSPP